MITHQQALLARPTSPPNLPPRRQRQWRINDSLNIHQFCY